MYLDSWVHILALNLKFVHKMVPHLLCYLKTVTHTCMPFLFRPFLSFHLSCLSPTKTKPIFFKHLVSLFSNSDCLLRQESKDLLRNYSWLTFADIDSTIGYGNFLTCLSLSLLLCTYQFCLCFFEATYDTNLRSQG